MHLADEILKLLVCEICFENFNEKDHLPLSLYPCGHTFCEYCINNLNNQVCPACNQKFQSKAKNWAIINLIPRARIPEVYEKLKEIIENSFGILTKIETMDVQKNKDYKNNIDWIRESINLRAEDLIKHVRELQSFLIERLDEFEQKWKQISNEARESNSGIKSTLDLIKTDIDLEEVKTSETKLEQHKKIAEADFNILNERLHVLNQIKNDLVSYKNSNLNLEDFSTDNLFGKLVIENLEVKMKKFKDTFKDLVDQKEDTYTEIENTLKEFDRITEAPIAQSEKTDQPKTKDLPKHVDTALYFMNPIVPPIYPFPKESQKPQDEFTVFQEDEIEFTSNPNSRKCRLMRTTKSELYGFELKSSKTDGRHYVKGVQSDSPASRAGLKDNDLILEVNDESVIGVERESVVKKMLKHSKHVDLTVQSDSIKKIDFKSATLDDKKLRATSINVEEGVSGSRMIVMSRSPGSKGFGFSLNKSKTGPHYVYEIDKNSPAASSGLKIGDCVLRLNGINLADKSFTKTIEILKKESEKSDRFDLEVIQPELYPSSTKKRADSVDNLDEFTDYENETNQMKSSSSKDNLDKRKFIKFFRKNKSKKEF